jgi:thiol-disulfide isomerase/thioredoxin
MLDVRDFRGGPVIVEFFASGSPAYRAQLEQLIELHDRYADQGLAVFALAVDPFETPETAKDVEPLIFTMKLPFPVGAATQNRGNAGQGVWKAELVSAAANKAAIVRVLHARRGSVPEEMPLVDFMRSCEAYFANEGCIVDQPFQPRLRDGMIRCYMAAEKVVGFGHQLIKALTPAAAGRPGLASRTTRPTHYAHCVCAGVSSAEDKDGIGVDAADDAAAEHRYRLSADHLGRRLSVWTARPFR